MPNGIDGHGRPDAEGAYARHGGRDGLVVTLINGMHVDVVGRREVQHGAVGDPGVVLPTATGLEQIQRILDHERVARDVDRKCTSHADVGSAAARDGRGCEVVDPVAVGDGLHRDRRRRHATAHHALDDLPIDVQRHGHADADAGRHAVGVGEAVDVHVARRRDRGCDWHDDDGRVLQRCSREAIVQVAGDGGCHPDGPVGGLGPGALEHLADLGGQAGLAGNRQQPLDLLLDLNADRIAREVAVGAARPGQGVGIQDAVVVGGDGDGAQSH